MKHCLSESAGSCPQLGWRDVVHRETAQTIDWPVTDLWAVVPIVATGVAVVTEE